MSLRTIIAVARLPWVRFGLRAFRHACDIARRHGNDMPPEELLKRARRLLDGGVEYVAFQTFLRQWYQEETSEVHALAQGCGRRSDERFYADLALAAALTDKLEARLSKDEPLIKELWSTIALYRFTRKAS
jgi:hypothetical protein